MKINEMEAQVGITKGNIRYYEKEGLLTPGRNSENGYRDYSQEDVLALKRIKLLRKLALPVEEIRKLVEGSLTVGDAARRHLITLERQRENTAALGTFRLSHRIACGDHHRRTAGAFSACETNQRRGRRCCCSILITSPGKK